MSWEDPPAPGPDSLKTGAGVCPQASHKSLPACASSSLFYMVPRVLSTVFWGGWVAIFCPILQMRN